MKAGFSFIVNFKSTVSQSVVDPDREIGVRQVEAGGGRGQAVRGLPRQVEGRHGGVRGGEVGEAQDVTELVDQDLGQLDLLVSDRLRGEDEGHSLVGERELRVDENVPAGA